MTDKTQALIDALRKSDEYSYIVPSAGGDRWVIDGEFNLTDVLAALEQPAVSVGELIAAIEGNAGWNGSASSEDLAAIAIESLRNLGVLTNVIWEDGE